jgi:ankyrin repeat protein
MRASEDQTTVLDVTIVFMQNERLFAAASQILLRRPERIHDWVGYSMWHATTYFDLHVIALHFLKCGTLPDTKGHEHILLYAVQHQSDSVMKALIQHGVDIDMKGIDGGTPFSHAVEGQSAEIVKLLLTQQDIDINSKDKDGWAPLLHAIRKENVEIVKLLLAQQDIDVNSKAKDGWTPFLYAVEGGLR